jgi:hypothetical protein
MALSAVFPLTGLPKKADQYLTNASTPFAEADDAIEKPAVSSGFSEADEGTRTLDLLHGKQML